MIYIKILFWISIILTIYTYIGYPLILRLLLLFKKNKLRTDEIKDYPKVTLFVTAYNEADYVDAKVKNSLDLDYPKDKLELVWVTDGSNDDTNLILSKYPQVKVYFSPERKGKINAMNRGMDFVESEIVIFSDGNTLLSKQTVIEMVKTFQDKKVGCIAGEKRVAIENKSDAASSGEGIYWKYESWVKTMDSQVGSCIGAAGELFAVRRLLYFKVQEDTILDDFIISLTIASNGYKVAYTPQAYAVEKASANVAEEMKRKVRIAAGSIQAISRLRHLLNPFKYKSLSLQYISHKVLRWVFVPLALVFVFVLNIFIVKNNLTLTNIYLHIFILQIIFYLFVFFGFLIKNKKISMSIVFVPYYFFLANWAMFLGYIRYKKKKQSVNWERAKRAK